MYNVSMLRAIAVFTKFLIFLKNLKVLPVKDRDLSDSVAYSLPAYTFE